MANGHRNQWQPEPSGRTLQHTLHRSSAINHQSTAASFTRRVTTPWPQATATNGNPNRQGGIAVHGQSSTRALCVIPTLNKPLCPRQLRLMKSAITPLLPRLHFGLPLRGRRPALQVILGKCVRELGAIRLIDSSSGTPGQLARNPRGTNKRAKN